jgi:hypothetical protein
MVGSIERGSSLGFPGGGFALPRYPQHPKIPHKYSYSGTDSAQFLSNPLCDAMPTMWSESQEGRVSRGGRIFDGLALMPSSEYNIYVFMVTLYKLNLSDQILLSHDAGSVLKMPYVV